MHSNKMNSHLESLAGKATNAKLAELKKMEEDTSFSQFARRVFLYTYSPFITFYVKQLPTVTKEVGARGREFGDRTWHLLDALNSREVTGHSALQAIAKEMGELTVSACIVLTKILQRDLGIGIGRTQINKVFKNCIPVSPYMRCASLEEAKPEAWEWEPKRKHFSQVKSDGKFGRMVMRAGVGKLFNRSGIEMPASRYASVLDCMPTDSDYFLEGEVLVRDISTGNYMSRKKGNGILNSIDKGGDWPKGCHPVYVAWDRLPYLALDTGECEIPYHARLENLRHSVEPSRFVEITESAEVGSMAEAWAHCAQVLGRSTTDYKFEGTILKHRDAKWMNTGSSTNRRMVKLKRIVTCELRIKGFLAGKATGKNAKLFGSVLGESECGKVKVSIAGLTDADRLSLHALGDKATNLIMAVTFNDLTENDDGSMSLFLPRFEELRDDKDEADDLARIRQQLEDFMKVSAKVAQVTTRRVLRKRKPTRKGV